MLSNPGYFAVITNVSQKAAAVASEGSSQSNMREKVAPELQTLKDMETECVSAVAKKLHLDRRERSKLF